MSRSVRIPAVVVAAVVLLPVWIHARDAREARVIVNSSHLGAVTAIASQPVTGRVFTAGGDGTVRVWQGEDRRLQRILPASPFEVRALTAANNLSLLATVSPEGRDGYRLGIWNWRTGREIYHFRLDNEPLTVQFSPRGNFLVYTLPEFRSLRFVNLRTGEHEQRVQRGFGIVSFVTIATSEERIMTYIPAGGRIQYWDLQSGDEIQRITTELDLEELTLLANRRHGVGANSDSLVVIDILNGETRAERRLRDVVSIRRDPETDQIGVVRRISGGYEFTRWEYGDGRLRRLDTPRSLGPDFVDFAFHQGRVLVAKRDGTITYFYPFSRLDRVFAYPRTQPVQSTMAVGRSLHLTVGDELITITSDFFTRGHAEVSEARFLQYERMKLPYDSDTELTPLAPGEYIVWTSALEDSQLYLLDTRRGRLSSTGITVPNEARHVVASDDSDAVYILDDTGVIARYELESGESETVYSAPGIQTFARLGPRRLLIAGGSDHVFDTPAVTVDTQTGETVPVNVSGFYILDMAYDAHGNTLYVAALERDGPRGAVRTTLTSYRDFGLRGGTRLYSHRGEDLGATVIFDPVRRRAYSTIGFHGVQIFDALEGVSALEATVETPERLYAYQDRVFGLNRSGSLSVWHADTTEHLLDFHAFYDGNWAITTPRGQYALARPDLADEYLSLIPGRTAPADLRSLELSIPIREPARR